MSRQVNTPHDIPLPASVAPILFVDLDGTLVATDLLREAFWLALRQRPVAAFQLPYWLLRGRAGFKRALAERVRPDAQRLPYQENVLRLVRQQRDAGVRLVLATASDRLWADAVAQHLGLFHDVIASDGRCNLKGERKLAEIQAYCQRHNFVSFGYIGDSSADLPIWRRAAQAYVVRPSAALARAVRRACPHSQVL